MIRLGEHNLRRLDGTEQLRLSLRLYPHPKYDPITREHDLMLIRLRRPASLGPAVRPLALGTRCPTAGTRCHISGWGSTTSPKSMTPKREIWAPKWRSLGLGVNGMTPKWKIWPQNGDVWGWVSMG